MDEKSISELKPSPYNPRRISDFDFQNLKRSITQFGDLSGIIKNISTGNLVGGHMRLEAFKSLGASRVVITHHMSDGPTAQGTTAYGYIVMPNGEQFGYREVLWDEATERIANIAANRIQGEFDQDLLAEVNELIREAGGDLSATGQSEDELKSLMEATGPDLGPSEPDDGTKPLHVRFTDDQLAVLYQAIGLMKRQRSLVNEPNADLDANALYYICKAYVEINTPHDQTPIADDPAASAAA